MFGKGLAESRQRLGTLAEEAEARGKGSRIEGLHRRAIRCNAAPIDRLLLQCHARMIAGNGSQCSPGLKTRRYKCRAGFSQPHGLGRLKRRPPHLSGPGPHNYSTPKASRTLPPDAALEMAYPDPM